MAQSQQEQSFVAMLARKVLVWLARPLRREHGKEQAKAHACDIRGFPPRWEMMGNQDRGRLCRFSLVQRERPALRSAAVGRASNEVLTVLLVAILTLMVIKSF